MSGPECCSNPPLLNPNAGAGHVEKLAGLDSYIAGSPNSNLAVLLISDVFGDLLSKFHLYSFVFILFLSASLFSASASQILFFLLT